MKRTFTVSFSIAIIMGVLWWSSCGGPDSSGDANRGMSGAATPSPAIYASPAATAGATGSGSPSATASPTSSPQRSPGAR